MVRRITTLTVLDLRAATRSIAMLALLVVLTISILTANAVRFFRFGSESALFVDTALSVIALGPLVLILLAAHRLADTVPPRGGLSIRARTSSELELLIARFVALCLVGIGAATALGTVAALFEPLSGPPSLANHTPLLHQLPSALALSLTSAMITSALVVLCSSVAPPATASFISFAIVAAGIVIPRGTTAFSWYVLDLARLSPSSPPTATLLWTAIAYGLTHATLMLTLAAFLRSRDLAHG